MSKGYAQSEDERQALIKNEASTHPTLFEDYNGGKPETEWDDMPEFVQNKVEVYQKIIVRFETEEDVKEFAKLIQQNITPNTKSIYHPKLVNVPFRNRMYVDES